MDKRGLTVYGNEGVLDLSPSVVISVAFLLAHLPTILRLHPPDHLQPVDLLLAVPEAEEVEVPMMMMKKGKALQR